MNTPKCPYCGSDEWVVRDPMAVDMPGWPEWYCRPCEQNFAVIAIGVPVPADYIRNPDWWQDICNLAYHRMLDHLEAQAAPDRSSSGEQPPPPHHPA